jgi:hypothetical protein
MIQTLPQKGSSSDSFINKASLFWRELPHSNQGPNTTGLNHTILYQKEGKLSC